MSIAYFDLRLSSIKRFPFWIHREINKIKPNQKFIYLYEQEDIDPQKIDLNGLDFKLIKIKKITKNEITNIFIKNNIEKLIVFAQRIPDTFLVSIANTQGLITIMYQHGLYIPFMRREMSLFYKNFFKAMRYVKYAYHTGRINKISGIKLIFKYINVWVFGKNRESQKIVHKNMNTRFVLNWGEYWMKYHKEQYGYSYKQQYVVGNPDFENLDKETISSEKVKNNTLCFITQTLVEDGRLSKDKYLDFILNLSKFVNKYEINLYVRLHPRSDRALYEKLPDNTVFSHSDFPSCNIYLGHYSSLIAKTIFYSNNLILIDFPGHEIPEYIAEFGSIRLDYDNLDSLNFTVGSMLEKGVNKEEVKKNISKQDYFFDSNFVSPNMQAAKTILKLSSNSTLQRTK